MWTPDREALYSSSMGSNSGSSGGGKLLAIGDMHLGMQPSGVPADLPGLDKLTPAAALKAAIALAIDEEVDGVLFAGDLVESMNARFEALRPLEQALASLKAAGIGAWAVVGNHDADALPSLAATLDGLELIGLGGEWEVKTIESEGRPVATICGWSFPSRHHNSSPLPALIKNPPTRTEEGVPLLGLLHGDLNGSGSYAPFRRTELDNVPLDGWLLGHVHLPSLGSATLPGGQPFGYLGSLVGLDGGEPGDHGPWIIHLEEGGSIRPEHVVNAPLRWEEVEIEVPEVVTPEAMGDLIMAKELEVAAALHNRGVEPRALGLRVTFTGRPKGQAKLEHWVGDEGHWPKFRRSIEKTEVFVHKLRTAFELPIDLDRLSKSDDPAGLLAGDLLLLSCPSPERDALLESARGALEEEVRSSRWHEVSEQRHYSDPLAEEALIERLQRAGTSALGALLAQREDGEAGEVEEPA